jgi:hypothetical protein
MKCESCANCNTGIHPWYCLVVTASPAKSTAKAKATAKPPVQRITGKESKELLGKEVLGMDTRLFSTLDHTLLTAHLVNVIAYAKVLEKALKIPQAPSSTAGKGKGSAASGAAPLVVNPTEVRAAIAKAIRKHMVWKTGSTGRGASFSLLACYDATAMATIFGAAFLDGKVKRLTTSELSQVLEDSEERFETAIRYGSLVTREVSFKWNAVLQQVKISGSYAKLAEPKGYC